MSGRAVERRALPPAAQAVSLAEAMLAAGNDAADRQAAIASRTATLDGAELRRLLVSQASVTAWLVRALARCQGSRSVRCWASCGGWLAVVARDGDGPPGVVAVLPVAARAQPSSPRRGSQ